MQVHLYIFATYITDCKIATTACRIPVHPPSDCVTDGRTGIRQSKLVKD